MSLAVARSFQLMKVLVRYVVDLSGGQNPTAVKTHADYLAWRASNPAETHEYVIDPREISKPMSRNQLVRQISSHVAVCALHRTRTRHHGRLRACRTCLHSFQLATQNDHPKNHTCCFGPAPLCPLLSNAIWAFVRIRCFLTPCRVCLCADVARRSALRLVVRGLHAWRTRGGG